MKILHVTLSFARGGRRNAISSLAEGLRALGVESEICCLDRLGCAPEEAASPGVPVHVLGRRSLFDLAALRRFRRICADARIDVVHTHDAASQSVAALTCFGAAGLPLLMTFHRSLGIESATIADRFRNALASLRCGAIVTGSRERRTHFLAQNFVSSRKLVQIPFGADLSRFYPDAEDRRAVRNELGFGSEVTLVGSVGHFGPEKGVDVAIRAFMALSRRSLDSPVALVIFGEGSHKTELDRLAGFAGGASTLPIRFVGFRTDMHRCLRGLDILLHAPRQEAFGLALIEAMATALPVVASRVGGIPELVREGTTGLLAESENPESFAQGLERLVQGPAFRAALGQEARQIALAEYGRELFARRHLELYECLLARRSPGSARNELWRAVGGCQAQRGRGGDF